MKEYKEIYNDIEYHVVEVHDKEIRGTPLIDYTKLHKYTIIRNFENDKLIKEMVFKYGKIHNEYSRAIMRVKANITGQTLDTFYLNGEHYFEDEKFKNELRKIRLDETLQH